MNNRIALYLSGQYPGYYRLPNRLEIIFKIRQLDQSSNFNDVMISQLQGKTDGEYFTTLLDTFEMIHGKEKINKLLDILEVPKEIRKDPNLSSYKLNLKKISTYLDSVKETDFSRFIIMPILQAMGYNDIHYKGRVNEADGGNDFFPISHQSPAGILFYSGVQVKSVKITTGSSSKQGSEYHKLVQELNSAFTNQHISNIGEEIYIDEMIVFNSKDIPETVIEDLFKAKSLAGKKIHVYARDGILSLIQKYNVTINLDI